MNSKWSHRIAAAIYAGIFFLLFACNFLTPYIADDFRYAFSFANYEKLESIWDIIPSMVAHSQKINGRLVAHTIVQLFSMLPNFVFDLVNAGMFVLQIILLLKLCGIKISCFPAVVGTFCIMWMFELNFGEVNLWQDGAINYLWSVVAGCLYMLPYVQRYMHGGNSKSDNVYQSGMLQTKWGKALYLILSFAAGAYSETVSMAAIFMAMMLLGEIWFEEKKTDAFLILCLFAAFAGYVSIYLAPAQWMNKSAEFSLRSLLSMVLKATYRYEEVGVLLIPYVVLLILNLSEKTDKKRIILSVMFVLASLAANYIMIFAAIYHGRSALGAFAFLLAANLVLVPPMLESRRYRELLVCAIAVFSLMSIPSIIQGSRDIAVCWINWKRSEQVILEEIEQGNTNITVPMVYADSIFCPIMDLSYLSDESADDWINESVAKYYGIESIIGVDTRQ